MSDLFASLGVALWLGIVTSLSPCPLTTNITAVAYIARRLGTPKATLGAGVLYAAGRSLAYVVLAGLLIKTTLSVPALSFALQKYGNQVLGPVLIVAGMFLTELIRLPEVRLLHGNAVAERMAKRGFSGAVLLGAVFALSFCPVSAALFFGSLIPLSIAERSVVVLPGIYGVGSALPVILFASAIAVGAQSLNRWFGIAAGLERWGRLGTGILFIAVGVYYTLVYTLRVI